MKATGTLWPAAAALFAVSLAPAQAQEGQPVADVALDDSRQAGIADVLSGSSGVRVATMCTNCNVASVTMCGQTGEGVQVWQDGVPVVGGLGAIYLLSIMPSQQIASTEIVRGPGTVLSGPEAAVGALVLNTKVPGKPPYLYAAIDRGGLDWAGEKVLASARLGNLGGVLAFTRSRVNGSDPDDDGNFDLANSRRETIGLTATYHAGDSSLLRADYVRYDEEQRKSKGGYFDRDLGGEPLPLPDDVRLHFHREDIDILRNEYGLAWEYQLPDASRLAVRVRAASRDQDTDDGTTVVAGEEVPYMEVAEDSRNVEIRYERAVWDKHMLTAGLSYGKLRVVGETIKEDILFPHGQYVKDQIAKPGAFAEFALSLPHRFDLTVGARYDRFDMTGRRLEMTFDPDAPDSYTEYDRSKSRLLPRARLGWKAARGIALTLSAGDAMAPPRPIFERVCCGATVLGNSDVAPQVSRNYLLEAEFVPRPWVKIRPSLYRNEVENYLQKVIWGVFPGYVPSFTMVNYPDVTIEGAELSVETRFFDRLSFGAQASHLDAEADQHDVFFSLMGQRIPIFTLDGGRIPYLPEDQAALFAKWDDPSRGIHVSAQAQYTGSMRLQVVDNPGIIGTPLFRDTPAMWVYNFRGETKVWRWFSIFAGVDNITDARQQWLNDPRFEYNWGPLRGRYFYGGLSCEM